MQIDTYGENLKRLVALAAESAGDDARAVAERLLAPLDAAIRLTLQDVVAAAAAEIICALAPGSVDVRRRGRELEFVVNLPLADAATPRSEDDASAGAPRSGVVVDEGEDSQSAPAFEQQELHAGEPGRLAELLKAHPGLGPRSA